MPVQAAILSVGDELTLGQSLDTNAHWLSARLLEQSIITCEHRTVGDDRRAIGAAIRDLAQRSDVLIITGGLGPTADDLTREALADVLSPGEDLVEDAAGSRHLEGWFAGRNRPMPAINRKQASRPASMRLLDNRLGTAPGLAGALGRCRIFSLPGPPAEMQAMFKEHVGESLASEKSRTAVVLTGAVHAFGMGESDAAARLGSLMDRDRNPLVGTTVSGAIVTARVRAQGRPDDARELLDRTLRQLERAWHPYVFARDDGTLAHAVAWAIRASGKSLATAESCTGGWLGKAIVDVAGSSDYYRGGWIVYSDSMKQRELGADSELLRQHGAVSAEVAAALARGAMARAQSDYALSITGIAGPEGGTPQKPVGTVHIALAGRTDDADATNVRSFIFPGDRAAVRDRSVKAALQMLRWALTQAPRNTPMLWETIQSPGAAPAVPRQASDRRVRAAEQTS